MKRLLEYYKNNNLWESHRIVLPEHRNALVKYYQRRDEKSKEELEKHLTPMNDL